MRRISLVVWIAAVVLVGGAVAAEGMQAPGAAAPAAPPPFAETAAALPAPPAEGPLSVEAALRARQSVREFADAPLALQEVARLLWAAQGETRPGRRTAPSAGALYPLEVFLVAGKVEGLPAGVYRYVPARHELAPVAAGDRREALAAAALGQRWVAQAPAAVVVAGVYARTAKKYGERAARYVHMEVGAAAQNVYLEATALGLGTVFVGAFEDAEVRKALGLAAEEEPLAILPVGRRK